jgi:acyl dehydratase
MVMNLTVDYPELTDSAIAEARKLIGVPLRRYPSFTEASRGSIMNWERSIGDRNPLYMDDYHGRLSRYGGLIAPPLWLYAIDDTVVAPKLPGIHCIYGAVDWEFFKVIRMGDTFTTEVCVKDVIEKQGKFCGRMVVQVGEVKYYNQKKELVAKATPKIFRTARKAAQEKNKYAEIQKHRYTREELAALEDGVDAEKWQGAVIRYWEDAQEGELMTPIVRGPLSSEDVKLFIQNTNPVKSYRRFMQYLERHPLCAFKDPASNIWEGWENQLLDDKVAKSMGFPFAHDCGLQRVAILGNLVTNWIGDDGFLAKFGVELRLPWIYGDTMYCKGKVAKKYEENGRHLVDLQIWGENQSGVALTANGYATVELISKSARDDERKLV